MTDRHAAGLKGWYTHQADNGTWELRMPRRKKTEIWGTRVAQIFKGEEGEPRLAFAPEPACWSDVPVAMMVELLQKAGAIPAADSLCASPPSMTMTLRDPEEIAEMIERDAAIRRAHEVIREVAEAQREQVIDLGDITDANKGTLIGAGFSGLIRALSGEAQQDAQVRKAVARSKRQLEAFTPYAHGVVKDIMRDVAKQLGECLQDEAKEE